MQASAAVWDDRPGWFDPGRPAAQPDRSRLCRSEALNDHSHVTWSVYVARCADGTLYCGIARDVVARLAAHSAGRGARYTRGRGPVVLLAARRYRDQGTALRVEAAIKKLARSEKLAIVADRRKWAAVARAVRSGSR